MDEDAGEQKTKKAGRYLNTVQKKIDTFYQQL